MAKRKHAPSFPMLLPQAAEEFIGRRAELDQLVRALQPGHTVTIFGREGIGKRSLVAAAINRLRHDTEPLRLFPDGVVTLSCEQYSSELLLLSALARALGGAAWPDPRASVRELLGSRRLLIVLENVHRLTPAPFDADDYRDMTATTAGAGDENAGDDAADLDEAAAADVVARVLAALHALLDTGQSCIVLTTAHPRLPLGEVIELGPLDEADGRRLLTAYAGDQMDDVKAAARVVELLGGLPLSLALAAMWMVRQDAGVSGYLGELEAQGLATLPPERRQSGGLAAVYILVLRELDGDAITALRLLSLLALAPLPGLMLGAIISPQADDVEVEDDEQETRAPVSEAMIEAVMAAMQKGAESLMNLSALGLLVEQDDNMRLRHLLLQELVIGGAERPGERVRQGFASQIAGMIERLITFVEAAEDTNAALEPGLVSDLLHLQAMLYANTRWGYVCELAARTAGSFTLPGYWYELFELTRMARRALPQLPDAGQVADYAVGLGLALNQLGFDRAAAATYTQALAAAEETQDTEMALVAAQALLQAQITAGEWANARRSAEHFVTLAEQQDDPQWRAIALTDMIGVFVQSPDAGGDLPHAAELAEQVLELQRTLGDEAALVDAMLNASAVWRKAGDVARSLHYAEPALEMARRLRDRGLEASALLNLGDSYAANDEARRALRTYEKALEAARRSHVKPFIAISSWRLAQSVEATGNGRAARKYYEQCLAVLDPAEVRDPTPAEVSARIAALRQA